MYGFLADYNGFDLPDTILISHGLPQIAHPAKYFHFSSKTRSKNDLLIQKLSLIDYGI